jgi:tRNA (guanine-N7-)-methyltransferase
LDVLDPYLLTTPEVPGILNWTDFFRRDRPVEVEIGFGKGMFLVNAALRNPEVNFVGVEIARKYQLFTATRLAKRGLTNVRLAKSDARQFFRDYVGPSSVDAIHVYFPDPWWKKRHLKRRVFTEDFACQCERVLKPAGRLWIATDVEEYFRAIVAIVEQTTRLRPAGLSARSGCDSREDYLTNFERKFRLQGKEIHQASFERTKTSSSTG